MPPQNVGLTLSGGGIRAIVFHLGALEWISETSLWNVVTRVSTVSGGSLAIGLLLSRTGFSWPTEGRLKDFILEMRELFCRTDLQNMFLLNHLARAYLVRQGRAALLADALTRHWNIRGSLADLPDSPIWWINTTCYETGRNWRFSKQEMGDYFFGYFDLPDVSLPTALAASAAVPAAIGPLKLPLPSQQPRPSGYRLPPGVQRLAQRSYVTLWDGGIYENLGVEKLFKVSEFAEPLDFLVVSDASAPLAAMTGRWSLTPPFYLPMHRLVGAATEQGRSYRVRALMRLFTSKRDQGVFIKIGNSPTFIFGEAKKNLPAHYPKDLVELIERIWLLRTSLRRLTEDEFTALRLHGYWTARATFEAWLTPQLYQRAG